MLALLDVDAGSGLGDKEAWHRLLACGENELRAEKGPSYWHIFLEEVYEGPQVRGRCVGVEVCVSQPAAHGGRWNWG